MFFKQLLSILNRLSPYTFNHGQNRLYLPSSEHLDQSYDHKTSDQFPSSMDSRRQLLLLRCKVYFQLLSGQHLLQLCTFSLLCIQVVCKCLSRHVCCPTYIWISSLNKCGSGHRKLRVCGVKNPVWSSSFPPPLSRPHTLSRLIFVMYFIYQPYPLLYHYQPWFWDFFSQKDRWTDRQIEQHK